MSIDRLRRVLLIFRCYSSSFVAYPWILARTEKVIVDVIAPTDHIIHHSAWVSEHIQVQPEESFIDKLCETLRLEKYDEVICVDEPSRTELFNGQARPELQNHLPFPIGSPLYEAAVDKSKFQTWCESLGLLVPESVYCPSLNDISQATKRFGYPYVIKATRSAGGQKVYVIRSSEDFEAYAASTSQDEPSIVQEYVDGLVGTTIFMARGGKLYAHCHYGNILCTDGGTGPAAVCQHYHADLLDSITEIVAQHVDGLTGFDWIQRKDGSFVLIDPHFGRVAPTGSCAHLFGVDFGEAFVASYSKKEYKSNFKPTASIVWVFPQCLQLILEGGFSVARKRANLSGAKVKCMLFADGEWRIFARQLFDYLRGALLVTLGALRRKLFGSRRT